MGATGITAVKDACVAKIEAWWADNGKGPRDIVSGVGRVDKKTWKMADGGRCVYVFRSTRADVPVNRAEDQHDYGLVIWIIEKFPDEGDPPEEWIDERVSWAESLLTFLGAVRGPRLLATDDDPNSGLWPESAELSTVYDVEDLTEHKAFSAVINVTYREQTTEG